METAQEKFDALVEELGAEATVAAIKAHRKPINASGTGCKTDADCGKGYVCDNGSCVLNVGP